MSAGTATALIVAGIAAAGTTAGAVYAANKSSGAAEHAADVTTQASTKAADQQSTAAANALAFQKQQAENDFKNQELARRANYDLNAAREQRVSSFGQMLGLPARNIPGYVPSQDPNYLANGTPAVSPTLGGAAQPPQGAPAPTTGTTNTDPQAAFMNAVQALGISPTDARNNLSKVTDYLNSHGMPGWAAADGKAGDYVSYQGQGFDVLPAGDKNWQWLNDNPGTGAATPQSGVLRPMGTAAAYVPTNIAPALQAPTFAGMLR